MRRTEITCLYREHGYTKYPDIISCADFLYKDVGEYMAVVIVMDNSSKDIQYKENADNFIKVCREKFSWYCDKKAKYLLVCCDGRKASKEATKAKNTCVYSSINEMYRSKDISEELRDAVNILEKHNKKAINYYKKHSAFKEDYQLKDVYATYAFAIVIAIVYLLYKIKGIRFFGDLGIQGISVKTVLVQKDYFRLISYMFVHIGLIHMVYNMIALVSFGKLLEQRVGWFRASLIFLYGGICAGALSCMAKLKTQDLESITVGSSGAVFAVAGAVFVYMLFNAFKYKDSAGKIIIYEIILIASGVIVNANVDMYAHIGGWITGVVLGIISIAYEKLSQYIQYFIADRELEKASK